MHLYRYFSVRGESARYLKKLCVETLDVNGDNVTYYCKDYLRAYRWRFSTMELKTSHDMKEIVQGVGGDIRFALKFYGLRSLRKSNRFVVEGIASAIYVNIDSIVETDAFGDIEDFYTYTNYCGNVFVDTSDEEKENDAVAGEVEKEECEAER